MNESTEYLLTSLTSKTVLFITQPSHAIEGGVRVTVCLFRMMYSAPVCISACTTTPAPPPPPPKKKKREKEEGCSRKISRARGQPAFLRRNKKLTTTTANTTPGHRDFHILPRNRCTDVNIRLGIVLKLQHYLFNACLTVHKSFL